MSGRAGSNEWQESRARLAAPCETLTLGISRASQLLFQSGIPRRDVHECCATREQHSAEEKIRIVLAGLRGEDSIAEHCRREGIAQSLY